MSDYKGIETSLKHEQLKEIIRSAILNGEFQAGSLLPSQKELCEKYGLSTSTVREAIGSLVHEGLLIRIQGKGTFVAERKRDHVTIGLVLPHLSSDGDVVYSLGPDLMPHLVHHIEDEAKRNGAHILLSLDNDCVENERENLLSLLDRKVDGIIAFYIGAEKNADCLSVVCNAGVPIVLIDRYASGIDTDYVVTDNFHGAYRLVEELLNQGFKRIVYFGPDEHINSAVDERLSGYRAATSKYGLTYDSIVVDGVHSCVDAEVEHATYLSARDVLEESGYPLAIITTNAIMLPGAVRAVQERGFSAGDYAMACFDQPKMLVPDGITFVHATQPLAEIGRKSVQVLVERLNNGGERQHIVLEPEIQVQNAVSLPGTLESARDI